MRVTLAVRPKVVANEVSDYLQGFPAKYWGRAHNAIAWLGARYLCHKHINRKTQIA